MRQIGKNFLEFISSIGRGAVKIAGWLDAKYAKHRERATCGNVPAPLLLLATLLPHLVPCANDIRSAHRPLSIGHATFAMISNN